MKTVETQLLLFLFFIALGLDSVVAFVVSKYSGSRALIAHSSAENIFFIVWKYINLIIDKSICERAIEAWPAHHSVFSNYRMPQGVKNEKSMQSLWDSEMDLWGITGWFIRKKNYHFDNNVGLWGQVLQCPGRT